MNSWTYDAAGRLTRERVDGVDWERTYAPSQGRELKPGLQP